MSTILLIKIQMCVVKAFESASIHDVDSGLTSNVAGYNAIAALMGILLPYGFMQI